MTFNELVNTAFSSLAGVGITIAAMVGFAYWLFRLFAEKWLDAKFNKRLEDHRHAQQIELENLRHEIQKLLDRATTLQKFEFEVLPQAWAKLDDVFLRTLALSATFRRTFNLDEMAHDQLEEFLAASDLLESQKARVREAEDKSSEYLRYRTLHELHEAREAYRDFHTFVIRNAIFIRPPLKGKFDDLVRILISALNARENSERHPAFDPTVWRTEMDKVESEGRPLLDAIEKIISERLWADGPSLLSRS